MQDFMHVLRRSSAAAVVLGLMSMAAQAGPSFDCQKDTGLTEQVICANPELGNLDAEMSRHYFDLINDGGVAPDTRQWAKQSQRAWLRERNGCGANFDCLRNVYQRRVNELSGTLYGH